MQHLQLVYPNGSRISITKLTYWVIQQIDLLGGGPGRDEYLVPLASQGLTLASTGIVTIAPIAPSVPLPPAAWLLGSGLIAMVGVARRNSEHKK